MTTLEEARAWLRERVDEGATCPCCTQFVRQYERSINSGMARSLIAMYRHGGSGRWIHVPTEVPVSARSREHSKLRYWGLVAASEEPRDDGGKSGWWYITVKGERYINDDLKVPRYATVYDDRLLRLHGDLVGIRDALGTKFDYSELMAP